MTPATLRTIAILSVTQITAWGTLFYGMMLFGPRIVAETGWSETLVYAGFSWAMLASGLAATSVGGAIDRFGGRWVMAAGSLTGGLGFALMALSQHPALFFLACTLNGVGMAASLYDAAFASVARVAGRDARRAISVVTLAGGLASTAFWPIGYWLLTQMSWREVALVYAALNGIGCALLNGFGIPPARAHAPLSVPADAAAPEPAPMVAAPLRRRVLLIFTLAVMMHGFLTNSLSLHLVPTLDKLGLTEGQAILAGALIGPAQSAARLIELVASGRYPVLALGLIATGLMPVAFAVLFLGGFALFAVFAFAIVYGASNGLLTITRGVLPLALFGRVGYGRTLGLIGGPTLAVKSIAPVVFAWLMLAVGPALSMAVLGVLGALSLAAMAVLVLVVRRNRPAE